MQTITVCGSMRFEEEMKNVAFLLESKKGFNVIQCTYNEQKVEITAQMMENLKKAHFEKIKMSDGIYVVDIDHYIGSSVQQEIEYAKKMNMAIKLLASSKREGESFSAIVAPMLLSENHPLCNVNDVFNAIFVRGNMLGDAMFYGSGAGKLPTASAVVADVVDAAKHLHRTVVTRWESNTLELVPNADAKRRFFVRIHGEESVLKSRVDEVFGQVEFVKADDVEGEFAVITGEMTEAEYAQKAEEMPEVVKMIRMAD